MGQLTDKIKGPIIEKNEIDNFIRQCSYIITFNGNVLYKYEGKLYGLIYCRWHPNNRKLIFEDEVFRKRILIPLEYYYATGSDHYYTTKELIALLGVDTVRFPDKLYMGSNRCIRMPRDFPFPKDKDYFNGFAACLSLEEGLKMYSNR